MHVLSDRSWTCGFYATVDNHIPVSEPQENPPQAKPQAKKESKMTSPSKKDPENHFPMRLGQKYCPQENFSRPQADPKSSRRIRLPKTSSKQKLLPQANSWIQIHPKQNCTFFGAVRQGCAVVSKEFRNSTLN